MGIWEERLDNKSGRAGKSKQQGVRGEEEGIVRGQDQLRIEGRRRNDVQRVDDSRVDGHEDVCPGV